MWKRYIPSWIIPVMTGIMELILISIYIGKMSAVFDFFVIYMTLVAWSDMRLILTVWNGFINKLCFFLETGGKSNPVAYTLNAASVLSSPRNGEDFPSGKGDNICTSYKVCLSLCFPGHNVGSLFHLADDLGRAMESLVSVMTDEEGAE